MKKSIVLALILLSACAPAKDSTRTVSNVVMGPAAMPQLPPLSSAEPSGVLHGRKIENVMIDIAKPQGVDYGNEDNPLSGLKEKCHELFSGMNMSVYVTNGTFPNDAERMFEVMASDSAIETRRAGTGTVPDAILKIDWREDRTRNPVNRVTSVVAGTRATLQLRAHLWGPDGKLVWAGDVAVPIKRASFITGGSVRNQFSQPARKAGNEAASQVFEKVRGFFIFADK